MICKKKRLSWLVGCVPSQKCHVFVQIFLRNFGSSSNRPTQNQKVSRSIEIELWGRMFWCPTAKNLTFSWESYLATRMQNCVWPSQLMTSLLGRGGRVRGCPDIQPEERELRIAAHKLLPDIFGFEFYIQGDSQQNDGRLFRKRTDITDFLIVVRNTKY